MELKFFTIDLPRILLCTTTVLALGACSSGSSGGDSESAPTDTVAPNDNSGPDMTGTPSTDTPAPPTDTPAPPDDTPAAPGDTLTPPDDTTVTPPADTVSDNVGGNVQMFGVVSFSQTGGQFATAEISPGFFSFNRSFPFAEVSEGFIPAEDTCTVESLDVEDAGGEIPEFDDFGIEFISAGEVITVMSPAGSYAEFHETNEFGFTFYQATVEDLPTPFPADMVLDIPGNVFPAFKNIAVPNVEPLVVTDGSGTNGNYAWTAGNNPDAHIAIDVTSYDPSQPGAAAFTTISCIAKDDGQFSIPASISSQLPTGGTMGASIDRTALKLVQSGNAILMITNSSNVLR